MNHRAIVILGVVAGFALGFIAGQNVERSRSSDAPAPERARSSDVPIPTSGSARANISAKTEYWTTSQAYDATKTGVSAWIELRVQGRMFVEFCRAPEYKLDPTIELKVPLPTCQVVVDGTITSLADHQVVVGGAQSPARTFGINLRHEATEVLALETDPGTIITLVPGSRGELFQRLTNLTSDSDARTRYMRALAGQGR